MCSILSSFFFGYFFGYLGKLHTNREPIELIKDINPKVCIFTIDTLGKNLIEGDNGEKEIRIINKDKVHVLPPEKSFSISL